MSVVSSISDDYSTTADSTGQRPSSKILDSGDDAAALPAIDHYNPHDLIQSWMKQDVAPEESSNNQVHNIHNHAASIKPNNNKLLPSRRAIYATTAILLLVIVVMIIVIAIVVSGSNDNNNSIDDGDATTSTNTPPPNLVFSPPPTPMVLPPTTSPAPTSAAEQTLLQFLTEISLDSGAALSNRASPQFKAMSWLASDPNVSSFLYSDKRKIQRYVLATLYFSTLGETWFYKDGWLSYDEHECDWQFGPNSVQPCGSNVQDLIDVELASNNLRGTLPPELALLSDSLLHLEFQTNDITDNVPSEIGLLTSLKLLDLGENNLTGKLPSEMGLLSGLTRLILESNAFAGSIPSELSMISNLKILRLGENNLSGKIPSEIGSLQQLNILFLQNNSLSGNLPTEFASLVKLQSLDISKNELSGSLHNELGFIRELNLLYLSDNHFGGTIPTEMGLMDKLVSLRLDENDVNGTVPIQVCRLGIADITVDCDEVFCSCCGDSCLRKSLATISIDGGAAALNNDNDSPQHLAFSWLLSDSKLNQYPARQVVQRYVLATLYFSLSSSSSGDEFLNKDTHECYWGFHDDDVYTLLPIETARASSVEDARSPSNAIDGDSSTRWASARSDPQWISVDLGEAFFLYSINLDWEDAYGESYLIQTSNNGNDWKTVFTENNGNGGTDYIRLGGGVVGRYLRMYGTKRGTKYGYSLYDIKVQGAASDLSDTTCDSNSNIIRIAFDGHGLAGSIPPELALLSNMLEVLNLSENAISGTLPTELGLLTRLNTLVIDDNDLVGSVPFGVCELNLGELLVDCTEVECNCCELC